MYNPAFVFDAVDQTVLVIGSIIFFCTNLKSCVLSERSTVQLVWKPNTFLTVSERVIFAFETSHITSAVRKSMLDLPVPGSF